jgi:hypothetical protein
MKIQARICPYWLEWYCIKSTQSSRSIHGIYIHGIYIHGIYIRDGWGASSFDPVVEALWNYLINVR